MPKGSENAWQACEAASAKKQLHMVPLQTLCAALRHAAEHGVCLNPATLDAASDPDQLLMARIVTQLALRQRLLFSAAELKAMQQLLDDLPAPWSSRLRRLIPMRTPG